MVTLACMRVNILHAWLVVHEVLAYRARKSLHSSCRCAAWVLSRVQGVGRHSHHSASREVLATRSVTFVYYDTSHKFTCAGYATALCQVVCLDAWSDGVMLQRYCIMTHDNT